VSPEREPVTLVVDGVEVTAPEGTMLVDAAKHGDVEIPVFCYDPKLGEPVGACRMCLVEIEGMPKLQTACSTPIRDGMVIYTQTERVHEAQEAVVEFLLVNHPLDCPVCDKGGECPLQDVAMGWGPGKTRMSDPKRHFQKPLPLSPLVRIDRERCILCYRCVRFSQEISEDEQLQLLERGDRTFVGTFDERPYVAPFHGNITELCPVGALTSETYRFRARPWDIEDAGSICTLCPSQCNVMFTVRDERVARVLGRDNHEVDDGWLCDKGRYGFQMMSSPDRITAPMVREGDRLKPVSWAEAIEAAAKGLREAGSRTAAIVGGRTSNEEGYLVQRILREALDSPHVDSTASGPVDRQHLVELSRPDLSVPISALERADSILVVGTDPLHSMPILDLWIRKAVRRSAARLAVASERPTALDGGAVGVARYAPGNAGDFLEALARGVERKRGAKAREEALGIAPLLRDAESVVVVCGEGSAGPELLGVLDALEIGTNDGSGLLLVPDEANARGLREVGCLPSAGPGLSGAKAGRSAPEIRNALQTEDLSSVLLVNADPVRDHPKGDEWKKAIQAADFVVSLAMFEDASTALADVVLPAETHAEKEGTVTHPDGRLQRLRPNVPHPNQVKPGWEVLLELSAALGKELGLNTSPEVLAEIANEVPFYAGITEEEIGGTGIRWQDRDAAKHLAGMGEGGGGGRMPRVSDSAESRSGRSGTEGRVMSLRGAPTAPTDGNDGIQLGTYRDLWASDVTDKSPALRFLVPGQTLELAPADAKRLGVEHGQAVTLSSNGTNVEARVAIHERLREGAGFMIEGTAENNANVLAGGDVVEVRPVEEAK
jgi:NADH-quinone oxidoreductase subunit G